MVAAGWRGRERAGKERKKERVFSFSFQWKEGDDRDRGRRERGDPLPAHNTRGKEIEKGEVLAV